MHVSSNAYGMYLYEARQRWFSYPPPYWYNGSWYWATPWLWYDGDPHSDWYTTWASKIVNRMNQPAPVTINMWGDYNASSMTGTIYAQFRNDATETLNGRVLFVITEDSIYTYPPVPNGDVWHNYVARDYLPNYTGTLVSIPAGDSVTVTYPFTIQTSWDENRCDIITFIQDTQFQADSTKEVWQGGIKPVMELVGVEEDKSEVVPVSMVSAAPNPCIKNTTFSFELPISTNYRIDIYDVSGRRVKSLQGIAHTTQESVVWDITNEQGSRISAGVYMYRFESDALSTSGKIVVR